MGHFPQSNLIWVSGVGLRQKKEEIRISKRLRPRCLIHYNKQNWEFVYKKKKTKNCYKAIQFIILLPGKTGLKYTHFPYKSSEKD